MALPTIPNTYRCTLDWSPNSGVTPHNVFHVYSDTGNESDVFATIQSHLNNDMFVVLADDQTLDTISIIALDSNSATHIHTVTADISGGTDGECIPASAAVLSLRTNQRGSRGRGRMFLGPIAEASSENGIVNSGQLNTMVGAWDTFREDMLGDGRPLVVASYVHADQHAVTGVSMSSVCGTQRRRQDQLR